MAELELNYKIVQRSIQELQKLPADYPAVTRPSVSGEGQGITEIEALVELYVTFYDSLEMLSEETAKYLNNLLTDFIETDEKRALSKI